jgi:hypothetical protein
VFVTVSAKTVDRIIEQRPHEARYFAEATLFRKDTDAMWHELVERLKNTL